MFNEVHKNLVNSKQTYFFIDIYTYLLNLMLFKRFSDTDNIANEKPFCFYSLIIYSLCEDDNLTHNHNLSTVDSAAQLRSYFAEKEQRYMYSPGNFSFAGWN